MESTGTFTIFRRYFPGLFVLLLAIGLGLRVSHQPPSSKTEASIERKTTSGLPRFKASDRSGKASVFPQLRKPISVTGADDLRISPEEARIEKIEAFKRESEEGRAKDLATIIRRLCRSGFTDEAFGLIAEDPSTVRSAGLTAFFIAAKLDDTAILEKIRGLTPEDRQTAWLAYLKRVPPSELKSFALHCEDLGESFQLALDPLIRQEFLSLAERAAILPHIEDLHRAGLVSDSTLFRKILDTPGSDPFTKWEELKKAVPGKITLHRETQAYFLRQMIDADPARVTQGLVQSSPPEIVNYHLRNSFDRWLAKDSVGAKKWFSEKEKALSSKQYDDLVWSFAQHFEKLHQPDEVRSWVNRIRNPDTQATLKRILGNSIASQTEN